MILTVTPNPAVDHTLQLRDDLVSDTVARTDDVRLDPGGKGINVSKYLVELDVETVATGYVGNFLGRFLQEELATRGVPNDFVEIPGSTRLNTTILTPQSEYKINQNGPTIHESDAERVIDKLRHYSPETVVIAGSLPSGIDGETIDRIAEEGPWETVVDVGGSVLRDLNAKYALCKPNRQELAAATGRDVDTLDGAVAAVRRLKRRDSSVWLPPSAVTERSWQLPMPSFTLPHLTSTSSTRSVQETHYFPACSPNVNEADPTRPHSVPALPSHRVRSVFPERAFHHSTTRLRTPRKCR